MNDAKPSSTPFAPSRRHVLLGGAGLAASTAVGFGPTTAHAATDLLAKMDEALNRWKTLDYRYKIVSTASDGKQSSIELRMRMKANGEHNMQLTEIFAPSDMKGMRVLILDPERMYVWLPKFKRIRRIASHVNKASFLGTALSADDMSMTRYSPYYRAEVEKTGTQKVTVGTEKKTYPYTILRLTAKGNDAPYPFIRVKMDNERNVPTVLKKYGESKKLVRNEVRPWKSYTLQSGLWTPRDLEFTDVAKGMKTHLHLTNSAVNQELEDKLFRKDRLPL